MTTQFKAGDAVVWTVYGQEKRGTIVETPKGSVAIIRDHETYNRTWAHVDSLHPAILSQPSWMGEA